MRDRPEIVNRISKRKAVVALIRDFGRPFTTEQLWEACRAMPNPISLATLYRILKKLRNEGVIKDICLPHGQQVSVYTDSAVVCVVECLNCGRYANCQALSTQFTSLIGQSEIDPAQAIILLRSPCCRGDECGTCENRAPRLRYMS